MENKNFSVPRRMGTSAFVILFCKELWHLLDVFVLLVIFNFKSFVDSTFLGFVGEILLILGGWLLISAVIAFLNYYFKTYYVSNGELIFKHGMIRRETATIPLHKIHAMRTKRGAIYRMLDLTGVNFDTLASADAEIELLLDDKDWAALLRCVETQEMGNGLNEVEKPTTPADEIPPVPKSSTFVQTAYCNMDLLKGAFCQNHFKGMAILGGVLVTLYGQVTAISEEVVHHAFQYIDSRAAYVTSSFATIVVLVVFAYLLAMLMWMGKVFFEDYNMVLRTDETRLFFEHGLVTRRSAQFSYDKVCTITVKQNFLEKWFKGHTVQLRQAFNVAGSDEKDKAGNAIKIYGIPSSVRLLQWWLGRDYSESSALCEARSGWGMFGYAIWVDVLMVLAATGLLVLFGQYALLAVPLVYLLWSMVKGCLAVRKSRITLKHDFMEISNGRYADVLNYVKYENLESVRIVRTPLTPLYHRVSLKVYTNGTSFVLRSLKEEEAAQIYELLLCWCCTR